MSIKFILNADAKLPVWNFALFLGIAIIILGVSVYILWRWLHVTKIKYDIHANNSIDILNCSMKRVRVYQISNHRSCYYNFKKVIIFPKKLVFDKKHFTFKIKKNIAHISMHHHHLSFNVKHIICLKKKYVNRLNQQYFVSTTKNYVHKEIIFLYRNHIFDLEFFNDDYKKILNNFKNSKISQVSLKRIRTKCYLRINKQVNEFVKKSSE